MRKFKLFFACLLMAVLSIGQMWATEVSFTNADFAGQGTPTSGSEVSASKNGVTVTCSKGYSADESLRCYAHGELSITASSTIEKINFTTTGGKTGGLASEVEVNATSYSVADLASQARFTEIKVTLSDEEPGGGDEPGGDTEEAGEGVINFGSAEGSTNVNSASVTGDDSRGKTWTVTTAGTTSFTPNTGYAQIGSGSKPASSITFEMTLSSEMSITDFSADFGGFSGTAGSVTLKVGTTTVATGSLSAGTNVTVGGHLTNAQTGTTLTVTVTNISKGVKAYSISYTVATPGSSTSTVAAPEISATGDEYGKTITITAEDGAEIYYTLNGDVPTATSTHYTIPFALTESKTVKAIAIKNEESSNVASETYTIYPTYNTIAQLQENAVNNTSKDIRFVFSNIQVTYINGSTAYISDGTNGALIFVSGIGEVLSVGKIINGSLNTKLKGYYGDAELTEFDATGLTIDDGTVSEQSKSLAADNLTTANIAMVVDLGLLTYDATNVAFKDASNNSIKYRNQFNVSNLPTLENGAQYNVKGLLISYSNVLNIAPRSKEDITVPATSKSAAETQWIAASKTVRMGDATADWWSTESDGAKSFGSSDPSVATISDAGVIALVAPGTTTLTFSTDETDGYYAGPEVSLVLTVKAALPTGGAEFTWDASAQGYTNEQVLGEECTTPVTITFAKADANNDPKYFTSDKTARVYTNGTLTITAPANKLLYEVQFDSNISVSADKGTYESGLWSGVAKTVVFTPSATSKIKTINVVYADGTETSLSIENINLKTTDGETALAITKNVDATINYSGINTSVATITDNKVTPVGVGSTTVTASIAAGSNYTAASTTFTITVSEKQVPALSFPEGSYNANLGSAFAKPTLTNPENVAVVYSSSVPGVATVSNEEGHEGEITLVGEGETVITATSVVTTEYAEGTASYTLNVTDPYKDVLTATGIGQSGYGTWSDKKFTTDVKYAGNSTTGTGDKSGTIQMRVQNPSGIVSTSTIGYLKEISATATKNSDKTLDIYAKNTAYESSADLYDESKRGTLIGTIAAEGSTIEFSENYKYIGIKAKGGAVYYDEIVIKWTPATFSKYTVTYEAGDATGDPVEVANIEEGTTIQLQDNPYTYAGHVFVGWSDGNDVYEAGDDYTVNDDVTLTAQWAQQFNVTYNPGEAGGDAIVRTVAAGAYNLEAGNIFTYAGHAFDGWLKGETKYNANESYPISENVAFTAQWVEAVDPVTVTFDATIDISDQTTSITKSGITITASKFDNNEEGKYYYQCFGSADMTVSSEVGNITNIELTCTAEGTAKYGPGNWEFAGYSYNSYNGSWAGSAETVEFGTAGQQVRMTQIVVTYIPNGNTPKQPAGLSYTQTSFVITQGESFTAPELNNPNNLVVTYSGNNDEVATVNAETGAITLGEATGSVTITASAEAQGDYLAGTASYTLTVNAPIVIDDLTGTWNLVTDASQLVAGKKVIIASVPDEGAAVTMSTTQATNNRIGLAGATVSEGVITAQNGTAVFTIEVGTVDNTIAFKSSADEYLYAASSESNWIRSQAQNNNDGSWIVKIEEGVATITAQGDNTRNIMRYNPNTAGNNPIFACYGSTSSTGTLITLYMHQDDEPAPSEDWVEVRGELTSGHYYTLCYNKTMTAIKGASLWSFVSNDGSKVSIVEAEAPYAAGTPYLIYAESDKLEAVVEEVANPQAGHDNGLYGTFDYMDAAALSAAQATHMLKDNEIRPLGTNNHLDANRAYIKLSEIGVVQPAPGRRVRTLPLQGQTATGIDALNASEAPVKMIIDGQLFILRGEKMYDVTGKLVK